MPGFDPQILKQGQQATASALQNRATVAAAIARQSAELDALNAQIAALDKAGEKEHADVLRAQAAQLQTDRAAQHTKYQEIDQAWADGIRSFLQNLDACDADPTVPLLLLPVRLETRYTPDGKTLRIRIFPDDVHVDQLDRGLSPDEQAAGTAYWNGIWQKPDGDPAFDAAWTTLVNAAGLARAAWVATALTPTNLGAPGAVAPVFPALDPPLRRAAIARLLPDRFVAIAFQGADRSQATGAPIVPELITGLLSDDGGKRVDVNGVSVPPGAEWVVDFNQALTAGMAINLPLKKPSAAIEHLYVCGVRSSLDPLQAEQELASLFTAHRCSRGLAFLPQGTPTNNTETDRAAWQQRPQPAPPARTAPAAGSNAAVLAAALGIDARVFAGLTGGDLAEQSAAKAMGVALWSPTWGKFLQSVTTVNKTGATLSDANKEATRTFFRDHVRARGPLPAIRVGQQPYGILPAAALSDKRWKTPGGDTYEAALLPLLRKVRAAWLSCIAQVPRVPGSANLDQSLRDVLGLNPISVGLRVRSVMSSEFALTGSQVSGAITDGDTIGAIIEQLVYEDLNLLSFTHPIGSLEKKSRPLGLALVDDTDPAVIDAILADGSPKINSVLQALLALAWDQAAQAVKAAAPRSRIASLSALATSLPATTRAKIANLSSITPTAPSQTIHALANEIVATTGEAGISRLTEFQPSQPFQTSLGELAVDATSAANKSSLASFALAAWFRANAIQAEIREALLLLKTLSKDDRRILLCETLDLTSHRLDAWLNGIVERRHAALRAAKPAGLAIGAYGWIENIAPGKGLKPDGGYIHAPGLTHAATAGILRSAFMTHNPDKNGSGAFAIDLSSARVRTALDLMDGVKQGQPLGALLGYRIERALHDHSLDRFTLTLRSLSPLVARRLTDRTESAGTQAQSSVSSNNVVDGLRLIDIFSKDPTIRASLTAPPKDNPYIKAGSWPAVTDAEWAAFTAIMQDAASAADAAADMLLAESVHQLVQGNMTATNATLNAVASGDSPPPQPDVVRTPSPGMPFTHRLVIASQADFRSGATGWNEGRPRAQAEPRLEQWAQARFGNAANVAVQAPADGERITLDAAALCALDLIYDSGDRAQLEQRTRAAIPTIPPDSALANRTDPAWPAGTIGLGDAATYAASLRALLVNAQPSKIGDFVRSSEPPTRAFNAAEIAAASARATAASGGLLTFQDHLNQAIQNFDAANPATTVELRARLEAIAGYGLVVPIAEGEHLLAVAQMAADEATRRIDEAAASLAGTPDEIQVAKAGQSLFGDGFWILATIDPPPAPDILSTAMAAAPFTPPPPRAEIRRFVRDTASVRAGAARASESLLLADTLGRAMPLRVAQLVEPGTTGAAAWIGGVLDTSQPAPRASITNLVLNAPAELDAASPIVALTIDAWVDVIPIRESRGDAEGAPIDERRVSGIALNAAAASARPPQVMLLAVSPDGQRWTTDALVDTLTETLELAKIRAVTLEITPGYGRVLPAAYQASYSLQGEKVLDLSAIATAKVSDATLRYIKETP